MAAARCTRPRRPPRFYTASPCQRCLRDELLAKFSRQSSTAPAMRIAMTTLERRFTYREVDAQATAIARGLVARGIGPRRRRRALDGARAGAADRPDRHRQDRRRLAALRRRRAGRAHRRLPRRRRAPRACSPRRLRAKARRRHAVSGADRRGDRDPRRRAAPRSARARRDAGPSRLSDLHLGLDRHAQGHRHHRAQHLPLPALGQ